MRRAPRSGRCLSALALLLVVGGCGAGPGSTPLSAPESLASTIAPPPPTLRTDAPSPATTQGTGPHTITGTLVLSQLAAQPVASSVQGSCAGSFSYSEIAASTRLVVRDAGHNELGAGLLDPGAFHAPNGCDFNFTVAGLPDVPLYVFSVDVYTRGPWSVAHGVTYSRQNLASADWHVTFVVGPASYDLTTTAPHVTPEPAPTPVPIPTRSLAPIGAAAIDGLLAVIDGDIHICLRGASSYECTFQIEVFRSGEVRLGAPVEWGARPTETVGTLDAATIARLAGLIDAADLQSVVSRPPRLTSCPGEVADGPAWHYTFYQMKGTVGRFGGCEYSVGPTEEPFSSLWGAIGPFLH